MVRILSFLFAFVLSSAVVGQSPPGWPPPAYSIERQWKNIQDYGATDDTAVSDYNAFSSAIAALSDSGGVVYVPPGRYRLDSTLWLTNSSNFTIKGSPGSYIYCMIEAQNSSCWNGILLDRASNVIIEDLVLIGDADSTALVANHQWRANGIFLQSCDHVTIRNCEVTHFEYGIRVAGDPNDAGGGQSENCTVENCQVLRGTMSGSTIAMIMAD
jgi:polygalacturonase